jgi:hypothetical protein
MTKWFRGAMKDRLIAWSIPEPNSGCWLWLAATHYSGYGKIKIGEKQLKAHRISYEIHRGPIPRGIHVLHHCDNPPCVNPDHLFLGTQVENNNDRDNKGRHVPLQGEKHGNSKFTAEQVLHIRQTQTSVAELAKMYGVNQSSIFKIRKRETWTHI